LRLSPWWQDEISSNPADPTSDCDQCKEMLTAEQRQMLACGFESPTPDVVGWAPPFARLGFAGMSKDVYEPTTCPGYTTKLPMVIEVTRARHWASKGELRSFVGGRPPEMLVDAVELLDYELQRFERYKTTPSSEGGGRAEARKS